jgi:predicted CoA-binding protein
MTTTDDRQILQIVRDAKRVAVYGMQDESKADRPAYTVPQALHARGFEIYPVNPNIESSLGLRAFAHIAELPMAPDILDVFRRSDAIDAVADEVLALPAERRPKTVWLQSGVTHPAAEAKLTAAGVQVVSDRCLAVYAARAGVKR